MGAFHEKVFGEANGNYVPISCHIARTKDPKRIYRFEAHWHDHFEIMLVTCGTFRCNIAGKVLSASVGDVVFINSRAVHSTMATSIDCEMLVLKFEPRLLSQPGDDATEKKYIYPLLFSDVGVRGIFRAGEYDDGGITRTMRSLERDFRERGYAYEIKLHMNCLRVFSWLLDEWKRRDGIVLGREHSALTSSVSPTRFDKLFDFVECNLSSEITTGEAAKLCRMSYGYFCAAFRQAVGMTFCEYINYSRITKAQQLLMSTGMTVGEVASEVGYSDSNYFIRRFRERCGVTPGHFRRSFEHTAEEKGEI